MSQVVLFGLFVFIVFHVYKTIDAALSRKELNRNDGVILPTGEFAYVRGIEAYEDGVTLYRVETLEGKQDVYRRDQLVKRLK